MTDMFGHCSSNKHLPGTADGTLPNSCVFIQWQAHTMCFGYFSCNYLQHLVAKCVWSHLLWLSLAAWDNRLLFVFFLLIAKDRPEMHCLSLVTTSTKGQPDHWLALEDGLFVRLLNFWMLLSNLQKPLCKEWQAKSDTSCTNGSCFYLH